jgi:glutamine synthetase
MTTQNLTIGSEGFISSNGAWDESQQEAAKKLPGLIKDRGIRTIRIVYCDQHGLSRGKTIDASMFETALANGIAEAPGGLCMDTSNEPIFPMFNEDGGLGVVAMGGAGDLILVPDPTTFKVLPWSDTTGWVLSDIYMRNGDRCPFDTRHVMRSALQALAAENCGLKVGLELEFYVFNITDPKLQLPQSGLRPSPPEVTAVAHGYQYHSEDRMDAIEGITNDIRDMAIGLGLPIRTIEAEYGPGQFEVTFNPLEGLWAADALFLFRSATKQLMRRQGRLASFMAKPAVPAVYSSGWHLHQSLVDTETGANLFAADDDKTLLTEVGKHYIGGLLAHAAPATAFSNPTINGYKRMNTNLLAPNRILWSHENRGAMLRLAGGYGDSATRVENRSGDPCANPYLYMASQVHSGLDGICNKTDPGEPVQDNPYAQVQFPAMPASLMESIHALDQSEVIRSAFTDQFIDYFLAFKRSEISRFQAHVTDWEHQEYFEMY